MSQGGRHETLRSPCPAWGDAFYQDDGLGSGGVVWVLKGDVLLTVQGVFLSIGTDLEADPAEVQAHLVAVAKIARKKA